MEWIEALVLGVVQGVTEFLPVSSDGHLTIAQMAFAKLTGHGRTGAQNLFFDVMLHLGTLTAIVVHYRAVVWTGTRGLLGHGEVPPAYHRGPVVRVGILAGVATLPLIPYAFLKHYLEAAFQSSTATGFGFLVTAAVLLLTTRLRGGEKGPREMTWVDALLIGIAQMFAPLPGVSRSGLTVAAALGRGLSRSWAVGFSLLIAVPAILGAAVFEFKDLDPASLSAERIAQTVAATVVAGVVGNAAIVWLVKVVSAGRLWYFSVYLIVLAAVVLAVSALSSGSVDARRAKALDGSVRLGPSGTGPGGGGGRPVGPLAGRLAAGAGPGDPRPGSPAPGHPRAPGLVLGRPVAGHP